MFAVELQAAVAAERERRGGPVVFVVLELEEPFATLQRHRHRTGIGPPFGSAHVLKFPDHRRDLEIIRTAAAGRSWRWLDRIGEREGPGNQEVAGTARGACANVFVEDELGDDGSHRQVKYVRNPFRAV